MKIKIFKAKPILLHDGIYFDVVGRASMDYYVPFCRRIKSTAIVERTMYSLTKGILADEGGGVATISEDFAISLFGEDFVERLKKAICGTREYLFLLKGDIQFPRKGFEILIDGETHMVSEDYLADDISESYEISIRKGKKLCFSTTVEEEGSAYYELKRLWLKRKDVFPEVDLIYFERF